MMKTWRNYCHTHWRIIILATLVGAVLAFTTVALIPAKFQTEMQILLYRTTMRIAMIIGCLAADSILHMS